MIKNLSMTIKLSLLIGLPLLGLIFLATTALLESRATMTDAGNVGELVVLSEHMGSIVHELQKERGLSAGFLGSKGAKFGDKLSTQKTATQPHLAEFKEFFKEFDKGKFGLEFENSIDEALRRLGPLNEKRNAVVAFGITVSEAVKYYTDTNTAFLNTIGMMAKFSQDPDIVTQLTAFTNFLQSKERAGIERAVLANVFGSGSFKGKEALHQKEVELINTQNNYLSVFRTLATAKQNELLSQKLSSVVVAKTNKMRKVAVMGLDAEKLGVDPVAWFNAQTAKINLLKEMENTLNESLGANAKELEENAFNNFLYLAISIMVLLGFTIGFGVFLIRSITVAMRKVVNVLNDVGNGRLDVKVDIDRGDEIGQVAKALDKTTDNLNDIISQVMQASEQVAAGSNQISTGSQALSQGATEQAATVEEITSTITELASQTKLNAENATQANQLATANSDQASSGKEQMEEMIEAMNMINDSSQEISKIIKVIDEIAFQTNLLALNAAVEAARAGKYGKGFAVVAEEVRNLAGRSAKAAKETSDLIESSGEKVKKGTSIAEKTSVALEEIVTGALKSKDLVGEIAAASNEQAEGIAQVSEGLNQISQVTQQNTANAEQLASSAEELSSQAALTKQKLSGFKLMAGNGNGRVEIAEVSHQPTVPQLEDDTRGKNGGGDLRVAPEIAVKPEDVVSLDSQEFGRY